jgi:hypothetical protein
VADLRDVNLEAELAVARAREAELREEIADLASGRRLARFVAERRATDDYRAQLGLVSRVREDFVRMSEILMSQASVASRPAADPAQVAQQAAEPSSAASRLRALAQRMLAPLRRRASRASDAEATTARPPSRLRALASRLLASLRRPRAQASGAKETERQPTELPVIERIVLYIDDLDRCPPRRVVEVLEAVHLILAMPLFIVVIAVDPGWLDQSLRIHYLELLAATADDERVDQRAAPTEQAREDGARTVGRVARERSRERGDAWEPTPLHYLEKIIQVPFALRPMGIRGVEKLVESLLPVAAATDATPFGERRPAYTGSQTELAVLPELGGDDQTRRPERAAPAASAPAPSLTPRTLALTPREREFAITVAAVLRTPRAVKKYTNLYRLLRAGLDEGSGRLDRFLDDRGPDVPEHQAALILLAALIAFPGHASEFLDGIGELAPDADPDPRNWLEYVDEVADWQGGRFDQVGNFLRAATAAATHGAGSTREPFRRWALEVSRYSFAGGQEVFARYHAWAALRKHD